MEFEEYIITNINPQDDGVFIYQVKPKNKTEVFSFLPGQFAQIKNPSYQASNKAHLFSISSSPNSKDHLQFCVKTYGFWTQALSKLQIGSIFLIKGPFGKFVWDSFLKNAVFLIGGVGVSPIMSMLRFIDEKNQTPILTLVYGNRMQHSIPFKEELDVLKLKIPNFKVIHVLSDLKPEDSWNGYKGFITEEILNKEVNFEEKPIFFLCGPPIFVEKMSVLLKSFDVKEDTIKTELFS